MFNQTMRFLEGECIPAIVSVGIATGGRIITNRGIDDFLERREGLTDAVMRRMGIGIEQRCWVEKGQTTSDLCVEALEKAMKGDRIKPEEISSLLIATSS